jgi:arylsulfatase A-like enzyme
MFGLDQGFELYDDTFSLPLHHARERPSNESPRVVNQPVPTPNPTSELERIRQKLFEMATHDAYRPDNEVSDRVIRWLREEKREPFFLWAHYLGPHEKPQPGLEEKEKVSRQLAQYDPDTVITDEQVGRVLTALDDLGLTDHTLVIVHADHGQSLLEHSYFGHGRFLYDPVQRIPMLMRLPGVIPAGSRVSRMVRNIDIFPTVLGLTGIQPSMPLDGVDLLPIVTGEDLGGPEETYVETYLSTLQLFGEAVGEEEKIAMGYRRLGMRTPEWKFVISDPHEIMDVKNPRPVTAAMRKRYYHEQLFNLRTDPGEKHDVINENRELAQRFLKRVWEFQRLQGHAQSEVRGLTEGQRERLRSLGYMIE